MHDPAYRYDPYHGIDLEPGRDDDEVADAATFRLKAGPDRPLPDCVICAEVLEHTPSVADVVRSAFQNLEPCGWFVVTCATHGLPPHSAATGAALQPDEFYHNVDPAWFRELLATEASTLSTALSTTQITTST